MSKDGGGKAYLEQILELLLDGSRPNQKPVDQIRADKGGRERIFPWNKC
jgi:hypothetical protein